MRPDVSIVVANWNGGEWIARCLSSLQLSAQESGLRCELIVVDDASADGSDDLVAQRFPRALLLRNPRNRGFAFTINRGALAAQGRVLILCNNDLMAKEHFVGNLASWILEKKKRRQLTGRAPLFAVSARTVSWYDGKPNQLCMGAVWRGGRITPAWSDPAEAAPCLFVQAGAAAYDRERFLELGGLSALFEPGYWEDYDVSWRAARRGWAQLYDPQAFALHIGGGSMSKRYGAAGVQRMRARNHLLFEAANLQSPRLLGEWIARMPLQAGREWHEKGRLGRFGNALRDAAPRFMGALRRQAREPRLRSDEEILRPWKSFQPS